MTRVSQGGGAASFLNDQYSVRFGNLPLAGFAGHNLTGTSSSATGAIDMAINNAARAGLLGEIYQYFTGESTNDLGTAEYVIREALGRLALTPGQTISAGDFIPQGSVNYLTGGLIKTTSAKKSTGSGTSGAGNFITVGGGSLADPTASEEYNAYENVTAQLDQWGLQSLGDQLLANVTQNHWVDDKQLLDWVRSTPQYAAQFPGLAEHNANGFTYMTETQYLAYRESVSSTASMYGVSKSFLTSAEIGTLVSRGVSVAEFNDRLIKGWAAVQNGDPAVRQELHSLYGINTGQLLEYYLNPDKSLPMLEKQTVGAEVGAFAKETGLGQLNRAQANRLSALVRTTGTASTDSGGVLSTGAPYDFTQVKTALTNAGRDAALQQSVVGQKNQVGGKVNTNELVGSQIAGFDPNGTQVHDQAVVQRAEQQRLAPMQKGGGPAMSTEGAFGAGHEKM